MPARRVFWIAAFFFALHNAEEAWALRDSLGAGFSLIPEPLRAVAGTASYQGMRRALVMVTALPVILAVAASVGQRGYPTRWLLLLLQATAALNAVVHFVFVLLAGGYTPGLVTALILNLPLAVYILRRAWQERWVSGSAFTALLPAAVIVHGPVLAGFLITTGAIQRP